MALTRKGFLVKLALLPVAVAAAVSVPAAAFASTYYQMNLTETSATVQAGGTTTTVITFDADRSLQGKAVAMSVLDLPDGVTASFSPRYPRVGGSTTLTLRTASSSAPGTFTVTISAIIGQFSSDPIGTTAPFDLTIGG